MLNVTLYPTGAELHPGDDALSKENEAVVFEDVDYVSIVNGASYGKPPLIVGEEGHPALARPGDTVLYINTAIVGAWTIEKGEQ